MEGPAGLAWAAVETATASAAAARGRGFIGSLLWAGWWADRAGSAGKPPLGELLAGWRRARLVAGIGVERLGLVRPLLRAILPGDQRPVADRLGAGCGLQRRPHDRAVALAVGHPDHGVEVE